MPQLALLALITSVVINIILMLIAILRAYRNLYGVYFALTILGVVLWALADIGLLFAADANIINLSAQIFYIAPMIIPVFIWFFAASFPDGKRLPLWMPITALTFFAVFAIAFMTNLDLFLKSVDTSGTLNLTNVNVPGFLAYASYFVLFFNLTYFTFMTRIKQFRGIRHLQLKYTFLGALFASVPALLTNLLLPILGFPEYIWLGPVFTIVFAISVAVAIVKHRLFSIRLVLTRAIVYVLSLAVIAFIYGVLIFALVDLLVFDVAESNLGRYVIYALLASVLAFTFNPIRRFFEKTTDALFYRDAYDPQAFISQFNKLLVSYSDTRNLLVESSSLLKDTFKTEYCSFLLKDAINGQHIIPLRQMSRSELIEHGQRLVLKIKSNIIVTDELGVENDTNKNLLDKQNVGVMMRIATNYEAQTDFGYLVLGNKKSGNVFTTQDIKMFSIIANELIIALQNAYRFEEIQRFNQTLQEEVERATSQLQRQNDRLKLLDQTKDDFIGMASHQLRTPLTAIKGYLSMVLEGDAGKLTPLQKRMLSQSFMSAQRMVYLISDLLNVSRLRTGKFSLEMVPTNLAQVVQDEIKQLKEAAKVRSLNLTYEKPEDFPTYLLDETKLRQVIMNFIDNAVYYTPGGGSIKIMLSDKPQSIEFVVSDTGIGVPKAEQQHMFTKYYRAHNAQVARPDGTGLGLFMAKKVIIAHGGAVIFKSIENRGSSFGFTIPKSALKKPLIAPGTDHKNT